MNNNKISENKALIKKVKKMVAKAKKKNLIQPHVLAFDNTPVNLEEHKGKLEAYRKE